MIRNVRDNAKQKNPYTNHNTNLRKGKLYTNRLTSAFSTYPATQAKSRDAGNAPISSDLDVSAAREFVIENEK